MQFISFIKCNTSIFIIGHLVRQVKRKLIRQWLTSKNFSLSINYNHYKFTVPQHLLFLYCDNAILISTQWHLIKIASRNILSVKWADQLHRCGLVWSTVCREPERIATSTSTMEFFWGAKSDNVVSCFYGLSWSWTDGRTHSTAKFYFHLDPQRDVQRIDKR